MKNQEVPRFPSLLIVVAVLLAGALPTAAQIRGEPRYGYQPEVAPAPGPGVLPGVAMGSGGERFFLDRFGRRFKIYRARPYHPGDEPGWSAPRETVPVVPPPDVPLGSLNTPAPQETIERARPFTPGENRYPYSGSAGAETVPDLSRYPKPPPDRDWRTEPLLRRTEPAGVPEQNQEWPPATRRPGAPAAPGAAQGDAPAVRREAPPPLPWEKPAIPRQQPPASPGGQAGTAPAPPPAPGPQKQSSTTPAADPYANLPYGVPVKGKKGFVTLEAHPNLPEIDVRGIAPGTPVEFPDPRDPAQIIQFRVPKFE